MWYITSWQPRIIVKSDDVTIIEKLEFICINEKDDLELREINIWENRQEVRFDLKLHITIEFKSEIVVEIVAEIPVHLNDALKKSFLETIMLLIVF